MLRRSRAKPSSPFERPNSWPEVTYGDIGYSDLQLTAPGPAGEIEVSAMIANAGPGAAEELVQVYAGDFLADLTRQVRELLAYRRVALAPGQRERVSFRVPVAALASFDLATGWRATPRRCRLWMAPSAEAEGVSSPVIDLPVAAKRG